MFGVKRFHVYLFGHHFELIADHKPLLTLLNQHKSTSEQASARIRRWALFLSTYEYTIKFRTTKKHGNADVLSRLPSFVERTNRSTNTRRISPTDSLFGRLTSDSCGSTDSHQERSYTVSGKTVCPTRLAREVQQAAETVLSEKTRVDSTPSGEHESLFHHKQGRPY